MHTRTVIIFIIVLLFASFLRLYSLGDIPPGINQDEGSIGYTAYSLIQTGKDEYGHSLPLSFQSFGDWKLPLYMYSVIPFVAVLGMTELAVRLPSAIAGIITVALTFFLVKELFKNNKLALLVMLLVAIAPWHLHLSRVESESNTAVMLITLAVLLFLRGIRNKQWLLIPSSIAFALTYYTYAGNHIFTTVLLGSIIFLYWKAIPKTKVTAIAALAFFSLFSIIVYFTFFEASKTKISGIGIFGDPTVVHSEIEIPFSEHQGSELVVAKLFHNKVFYATERFIQNYLNAFSPNFLFISGGGNNAHNIDNFGNMYIVESIFLLFGIISLLTAKRSSERLLVLLWFLLAPIAPSITKDAPHTNRMFAIFPILPLVTGMGIFWFLQQLHRKNLQKAAVMVIVFAFAVNVGRYMDQYYVHFPRNERQHWGIEYKLLSKVLTNPQYMNRHVIMSRPEYSHYIYLLFYQNYDPLSYQREAVRYAPTSDAFVHVKEFGRYEFRDIDWSTDIKRPNVLLVDFSKDVPEFIKDTEYKTYDVILPDEHSMFTVVATAEKIVEFDD